MSVYRLFVEGNTETQIINAIKAAADGSVLIEARGSKDRLPNEVISERSNKKRSDIYLLRDRDFDFDVPSTCHADLPAL
jgi:hypothetical protein